MTTIEYNSRGEKCIVEVAEGVTHAEITSFKLPDLGEPTLQDRLVDILRDLVAFIDVGMSSDIIKRGLTMEEARTLLASLERNTK